MTAGTHHIMQGYLRGAAYLFLLLCFIASSIAPSPYLARGMTTLVPVTGTEELPSEENHSGQGAPQEITSEARRARRDHRTDLQATIDTRPARGGTTALTSRPQMAYLLPREHELRFGLGTPLRI